MELLTQVRQKTDLLKMLRIISLGFGLVVFVICTTLSLESYSFDRGFLIGEERVKNLLSVEECCKRAIEGFDKFPKDGLRTYEGLAYEYKYLAWILLVFLIGNFLVIKPVFKLRKAHIAIHLIGFSLLTLTLYQFWRLLAEKNLYFQDFSFVEPYDSLLHASISYDWICLAIIGVLLPVQLVISFFCSFGKNYNADFI